MWGNGHLALIQEERWKDRKRIILAVAPDTPAAPVKLFEGSFEDRYHDPGQPFETANTSGKYVLQTTSDSHGIYFHAEGASPEGDRPFVSVMSATTGESKRLWQSADKFFEYPVSVLDAATPTILLRRESPELPPNYYRKSLANDEFKQITFFPSPYGNAPLPKKQVLKYKRGQRAVCGLVAGRKVQVGAEVHAIGTLVLKNLLLGKRQIGRASCRERV